ncbi:MAG TPA: LamG-like jellyroll fold domain-containing protein, partial [Clostridia bacterium]|nr:LamG-like jellyroll fold domain-containing protein [Clostridia bacterium]
QAFNTVNAGEPDVVTNKWTHLVGTYDAETKVMALYVDGTLARGLANVTHGPNIATPLRIGAGSSELKNGQYHWRGGVDEVAIYPGALSPQRVQAHYQAATGVNPALVSAPGAQIEPLGQTNWAPYPVTVSCVVTGSLPMTFQWYKVSPDMTVTNLVPNATNMVLQLANTSPAQDGYYYLAATNGLGGTETAWAYVEIRPLTSPVLTLNSPASVPVYANGTAGIPALADGTPVIGYQWQSNNVNIASATNPVLQVPQVQPSFSTATYKVLATNFVGATVGDPAQLSVLTPPPATYAAVITGFNPLAYWRFGETGGAYAFDYWGGHPAVYSNAFPASLPGALLDNDDGGVTAFGAGSFVQTVEVAPFNFTGTQPFTLATWVKVDAFPPSGVGRIFSNRKQLGGAGGYGIGFLGNNTLRFTGFGVADVNASVPSFTAGQWYHIAAVRSNTTVYLYIDGVLKNSGTVANINPSIYPLRLAGNANFTTVGDEEAFNGTLDEAAVFSRDLSAAEISALYAARYGSLNPPTITREPNPSVTLVGGTARFDVQAGGSQPLGYVWRANGSPIAGATNASLVLSNVTAGLNGINYTVTITNSAGTITSVAALLTVQQAAAYSAAVVADNPVAFWRLNESFGPVVHDVWGGYNGLDSSTVVYNAPGALAGTPDTAATFDGMSSKVDVAYNPALNPPSFTFEAWARVTGGQGTYRCVMATRDEVLGDNQKGAIIYATAGNIWSFWTSVGSGWQTVDGPAVVLDKWTHLAAVYDGTTKSFYVDGVLAGSAIIQAVPNIVRPLRIGAGRNELDTGDYWFYGDIDEVALYNKGLTADRVAYHYEYGKYGPNAAPVILRQPSSLSVVEGNDPVFRVQAGGTPTLGYQWLFNNTAISGATASVLTIENAYYTDAGSYKVRITNALGSVESLPATLTVGAPPSYAYLTNQLVLHLKFENNAQDSSGRGNHGTELGAPTYVPGRLGQALHYNTDAGATTFNYVTLGQPADLLFSSNVNFSVSYWVRFTGTPNDLPFICNALNSYGNSGLTFAPGYGTGTWSWSAVGTTANVSTGYGTQQINDGQWHHLVHTFDRTGAALTFLDGQLADSRWFDTVGDVDTAFPINIGQDPTGVYAENGAADIDDIAIWRKALTPYDAQSIYAAAANNQSIDTVGPVQLRISQAGLDIELIWQSGTLQEATQVNGTYTPVQGATAPYFRIPVGTGAKFYRIRP